MTHPWTAERAVSDELARTLIEEQFPELAPAQLEPFGVGWDNTAFLVNGQWVFRFPRRQVAVELLETESRLLSAIAGRLPLPVPVPEKIGQATESFPWPFAGYRLLPGRTACGANLSEAQRARMAEPLAEFLVALHSIPVNEAARHGAPPDKLRRLDVAHRVPQIVARLEQVARLGLLDDIRPWVAILDRMPDGWVPGHATLVHGDLYVRHLLVDDEGRAAGVIDWGDVHRGDPAVDLSVAHGFLPPAAHQAFRRAYGRIEDDSWQIARFRALLWAAAVLVYGYDVKDQDLVREGLTTLRYVRDA